MAAHEGFPSPLLTGLAWILDLAGGVALGLLGACAAVLALHRKQLQKAPPDVRETRARHGSSPTPRSSSTGTPGRWWAAGSRRWLRRLLVAGLVGVLTVGVVLGASIGWVRIAADGHVYSENDVPAAPVAVVFGAQVYRDGRPSAFLVARLALARRLYTAGTVKAILVTGDHGHYDYDEPDTMRRWLTAHGVPARQVVTDHAGFDTYQSCARAVRIFGVRHAILVSQDFHVPRAVALCRAVGMRADGVGDTSQRRRPIYRKNWARDQAADVKAAYDMTVQPDPTYLGRRETGVDQAVAE
ncbi:MAG: ElyC/SanA/YdcF family protein [Actinocatenispora sp.]